MLNTELKQWGVGGCNRINPRLNTRSQKGHTLQSIRITSRKCIYPCEMPPSLSQTLKNRNYLNVQPWIHLWYKNLT